MLLFLKQLIKKWVPQYSFLQRFYLGIYYMGLWGMNYGRTADLNESGELNVLKKLKFILPDNPIFFDVGANVGEYSILLNQHFTNATILAFEPVKNTYDLLSQNTSHTKSIQAHHLGFGDQNHQAEIYSSSTNSHSSMVGRAHTTTEEIHTEEIELMRLSDFVLQHKIDRIDFLKIDVEGYEINVLRGAKELLQSKRIHCIQFEFGGTMIDAHVFLKDFYHLLENNYNLYRITKAGLYPIGSYQAHFEIFHYCNYMAILK
ncbi:MAG: FkbM family methyltransferase [Cyclobacteriaceae bacterium]